MDDAVFLECQKVKPDPKALYFGNYTTISINNPQLISNSQTAVSSKTLSFAWPYNVAWVDNRGGGVN
jgi:hypothetical protein